MAGEGGREGARAPAPSPAPAPQSSCCSGGGGALAPPRPARPSGHCPAAAVGSAAPACGLTRVSALRPPLSEDRGSPQASSGEREWGLGAGAPGRRGHPESEDPGGAPGLAGPEGQRMAGELKEESEGKKERPYMTKGVCHHWLFLYIKLQIDLLQEIFQAQAHASC
nr:collagen alpha-1(I) chain-like [Microcebus murinus]